MNHQNTLVHIDYQQGALHLEAINIQELAEHIQTPFYAYSEASIVNAIHNAKAAFESRGIHIHYAVKANGNLSILKLIRQSGIGVDIVSGGELMKVLEAGFSSEDIVFSGVGKTAQEIDQAINANIGQFNIESVEELRQLINIAEEKQCSVNAVVRVNPEVSVDTHQHITTGSRGNKFGVYIEQVPELFELASQSSYVNLRGVAMHIGSQIQSCEPYRQAIRKLISLTRALTHQGFHVDMLDLGGGFGITDNGNPGLSFDEIAQCIADETTEFSGNIAVEPGRSIIANAGILVSRVIYRKASSPRSFLILDAGMNDLMRPALYQAQHPLMMVQEPTAEEIAQFDVVGPVCESTDTFVKDLAVNSAIQQGDLVVFTQAGAYCSVLSSTYNGRALPAEVLVTGNTATVIRQRQEISDQLLLEKAVQPLF